MQNTERFQNGRLFYQAVFGKLPFRPEPLGITYQKQLWNVRLNYRFEFLDRKLLFEAGVQTASALAKVMNHKNKMVTWHYTGWNGRQLEQTSPVSDLPFLDRFLEGLGYWETDEEFTRAFYAAWRLELK